MKCKQCGVELTHWQNKKTGYCTECYKPIKKEKEKAYYEANKEKAKAWREANKEKRKAQQKAWYEANKEKIRAQQKAWREANKELIKAQNRLKCQLNHLEGKPITDEDLFLAQTLFLGEELCKTLSQHQE